MQSLFSHPLFAEFKKIISFGMIGAVNFGIDYAVFTFLAVFVVGVAVAENSNFLTALINIAAWAVAVCGSYVMNSKITFKAETDGQLSLNRFFKFAGAGIFGMIANTIALIIAKMFMPLLIAKIIALGVSFVVNFTVTRFFVFKSK